MNKPELIVMLTHNDYTVKNALEIFEACKHTPVTYWGVKEQGVSPDELIKLCSAIKENGKSCVLEVVSYSESTCLESAEIAVKCGCDILLGTKYFDSVNELCHKNNIRYMPFAGEVSQRPSVLEGSVEDIISESRDYLEKGVAGIDLLAYRYKGDIHRLCRAFTDIPDLPLCLAGSINSFERLDEVKKLSPQYFTIGGAFFENCFGEDIAAQIELVCRYISK